MYAAQIAAAGYLPLALSGSDYLELLPVAWRTITAAGIRVGSLTYDSAELNPYRGQPSAHRVRRGKWPVHHDPYDLGQVWVRRPDPHGLHPPEDASPDTDAAGGPAGWIEVAWIHRGRAPVPFADFTLRHTRRVLAERGGEQGQLALAEALNALLTRAETGPDTSVPAARTARRIVAKTRSAGPSTPHPAPPAAARQLEAVDGCGDLDDGETDADTGGGDDQSPSVDAVVPFGVFDAHAEAKRFW